jgi:hypothetical protein
MPTPPASVRTPAWAFTSSRLLLLVTAYFTLTQFPVHTLEPWMTQVFPENNWIDGWVRWDAFWYEAIVDSTNRFLPQGHSSANFFPFYGWAAWIFALPFQPLLEFPKAFYVGGILLSHVAFLLGLIGVFRIAETIAGHGVAERTVWRFSPSRCSLLPSTPTGCISVCRSGRSDRFRQSDGPPPHCWR